MADSDTVCVDFQTDPSRYKHWKLSFDGPVATLAMDVREDGGLRPGYELKLNSYDLGVDVELYDAVQRLRFEHPEVGAVVITSGKERVFCAGANIRMLSQSPHAFKVNFCKFTNETRNAIEDATVGSRQVYLTAVNGPCAGGGYELALATDWIIMADDGNTAVSLPEVPLLAVLPGTGGLTRLVDKRHVRRDRADFFCTTEEGVRGKRAAEWGLVDEVVPRSRLAEVVRARARELAARTDRPATAPGLRLLPLERTIADDAVRYRHVACELDRTRGIAWITVTAPGSCFVGTLLELALAADRSYMLDGTRRGERLPLATVRLTEANFGAYPMPNGLTRIANRHLAEPARVEKLRARLGEDLDARAAAEAGLVTFTPDDIDWDDEVRQALEARAAFSPDALTGMEASLRFGGPETLETKIFGRLSAWQNWIFQRPNAVGPKGALQVYGTGERSDFDRRRV